MHGLAGGPSSPSDSSAAQARLVRLSPTPGAAAVRYTRRRTAGWGPAAVTVFTARRKSDRRAPSGRTANPVRTHLWRRHRGHRGGRCRQWLNWTAKCLADTCTLARTSVTPFHDQGPKNFHETRPRSRESAFPRTEMMGWARAGQHRSYLAEGRCSSRRFACGAARSCLRAQAGGGPCAARVLVLPCRSCPGNSAAHPRFDGQTDRVGNGWVT